MSSHPDHDGLRDMLAEQRRVLVNGRLDPETSTDLAARLMAFDGMSQRDVQMIITSAGGPVAEVLPLLDVLSIMRARVNITALGAITGAAVGLVAAGTGLRQVGRHATFSLRLDTPASIDGSAEHITLHVEELTRQRTRYVGALAAATGRELTELTREVDRGSIHTADEAVAMGIVDAVAAP